MKAKLKKILAGACLASLFAWGGSMGTVSAAESADLVVYGRAFTADADNRVADAFAVKDGKYVYVGDAAGAKAYIEEGVTQVVTHAQGLITPGGTEGHGHYTMKGVQNLLMPTKAESPAELKKELEAYMAEDPDRTYVYGFGWSVVNMPGDTDYCSILDEVCPDIPVFLQSDSGHQAIVNTKALELAGMAEGEQVEGGRSVLTKQGLPTGYLEDQAVNKVVYTAMTGRVSDDITAEACRQAQDILHSQGYTNYLDAWLNITGDGCYKAFRNMDEAGTLSMNVMGCYEIDSWQDWKKEIQTAKTWKAAYETEHFMPSSLKLFIDGVPESGTGYVYDAYKDGTHGAPKWQAETLNLVVADANANGILTHSHAMGDHAVSMIIDACEYSNRVNGKSFRNGLGHLEFVRPEDYKRIKEDGLGAAENLCWHTDNSALEDFLAITSKTLEDAYPIKSFFDYGIPVSSSTDAPAAPIYPSSFCGIVGVAVTGLAPGLGDIPGPVKELVTVEQALRAMTINGAWQLGIDDKTGSIEVGKNADFILLDKDLLSCAPTDIGNGKVESVYFEGKQVWEK